MTYAELASLFAWDEVAEQGVVTRNKKSATCTSCLTPVAIWRQHLLFISHLFQTTELINHLTPMAHWIKESLENPTQVHTKIPTALLEQDLAKHLLG